MLILLLVQSQLQLQQLQQLQLQQQLQLPVYALLLLRTGQTVDTVELTRLAACRGDVVMTIALLVQFGASLKKVKKGNKILQKGILMKTRPYGYDT